jgi:NDP-sugar pyrophosphorylase family protein
MQYSFTTTRAVILAAGLGSRLRPFTDTRPKPLVWVRGTPILHNALHHLAQAGIQEATIVVGYRKEAIERSCGSRFHGIELTYAESSIFDRTGSAFSLWLARHVLQQGGDVVLLEGDVFFELPVLERVLALPGDVAAVAEFEAHMSGTGVVLSDQGRVAEFRTNQTAADLAQTPLFKTINVMRFTARTLRETVIPALDRTVAAGNMRASVEQILGELVTDGSLDLRAAVCDDLRWYEIDNEEDLRTAELIFDPNLRGHRQPAAAMVCPPSPRAT